MRCYLISVIDLNLIPTDEDLILSHDEAKHESKTFGTIKVTIMRGHSQQRTDPNAGIIPSSNRQLDQHSSSKRVIKDNGVTHSVKYDCIRLLDFEDALTSTVVRQSFEVSIIDVAFL